jgi:integration host factor subunit alpha
MFPFSYDRWDSGGSVDGPRERGRTKAFLVDAVYDRHGALTKQEAAEVVDQIFGAMKLALIGGRPVRIQNFGVFEVVARAGRAGINPADGQPLFIPPHRGLQFRPSKLMRHQVEPIRPRGERSGRRSR